MINLRLRQCNLKIKNLHPESKFSKISGRSSSVAIIMGQRRSSLRDNILELVEIKWGRSAVSDASGHLRSIFQKFAKSHSWAIKGLFSHQKFFFYYSHIIVTNYSLKLHSNSHLRIAYVFI